MEITETEMVSVIMKMTKGKSAGLNEVGNGQIRRHFGLFRETMP